MFLSSYPERRSFPKLPDSEEERCQQNKSPKDERPCFLDDHNHNHNHNHKVTSVPSSKTRPSILPWIDDLVDRAPLPVSKDGRSPSAVEEITCEEGANDSSLSQTIHQTVNCEIVANDPSTGIPVKSPVPHEETLQTVACEERTNISSTGIPTKSPILRQTPLQTVTFEEEVNGSSTDAPTKSKWTVRSKMLSAPWLLVVLLFLINILSSPISAQVSVNAYVTYVGGTDAVNSPSSNTPPNVSPDARAHHAGFYERSQKCYYTFGGFNGGN